MRTFKGFFTNEDNNPFRNAVLNEKKFTNDIQKYSAGEPKPKISDISHGQDADKHLDSLLKQY